MSKKILCAALAMLLVLMTWTVGLAKEYTGVVNTGSLRIRKTASTESATLWTLSKGDEVTILGVSGDFYRVRFGKVTGYVMAKYIKVSSSVLKELTQSDEYSKKYAYLSKIKSIAKLGDAPAPSERGDSGEDVAKLQQALKLAGYNPGIVDGSYGKGTEDAVVKFQKAKKLTADGKAGNNTIKALFGKLSTTTVQDDPRMGGYTRVSQIPVPATSRPGNSGSAVTALQQALKILGYYKAPIDGGYGAKTEAAVKAYQEAKKLTADGVAGNNTIKSIFGTNASDNSYKTERLDWFVNGSSTIPKGAVITVKDVATGKTFSVKRWSGTNHLDGEPVSSSDTATMKAIYGGVWSWKRRAILVQYKGHVYAASMNGMPHGTTTISGNNFDGHFCIHFYNSRTHETNKVDAAHQNAVSQAMNAHW